jgi:hypothetical protein
VRLAQHSASEDAAIYETEYAEVSATRFSRWFIVAVAAQSIAAAGLRHASAQSFTGIGGLNSPATSLALAVSPDGSKVTGESNTDVSPGRVPFIWSSGSGMTALAADPLAIYYALGTGITNSGIVAGFQDGANEEFGYGFGNPTRWDPESNILPMPAGFAGDGYTLGNSINGSGSIITAYRGASDFTGDRPMVWVNDTPQLLNYLHFQATPDPYTEYGYAKGLNTPGTRIGGTSDLFVAGDNFPNVEAVLWSDDTALWDTELKRTPVGLGFLPGISTTADTSWSDGSDVSNNGQVVVGAAHTGLLNAAIPAGEAGEFRTVGFVTLGVPGGVPNPMAALADIGNNDGTADLQFAVATSVNGDATVGSYTVVGYGYNGLHDDGPNNNDDFVDGSDVSREAVMWTTAGVQNLEAVATGLGLNIAGWDFQEATGVSDNGRVIVGWGKNPQGNNEGWVLTLPSASFAGDFNNDGSVNSADFNDPVLGFKARFGADLDGEDLLAWQRNSGQPGSVANASAVPEPTALAILAACGLRLVPLAARRRRR